MRLNKHNLTDFQKAVYCAVMQIPLGETRSYTWVAKMIGSPRSARAVGNALNKNPYAPYVPCHRVVASDGRLAGYSEGLKKKIALLKKEKVIFSKLIIGKVKELSYED